MSGRTLRPVAGVRRAAALLAAMLLAASAAHAFVPPAPKIAKAIAERNVASGRAQDLQLRVVLEDAQGAQLATGIAWLVPSGDALLELQDRSGGSVRQVRTGGRLVATRDGTPVANPHPLLPPFELLQAGTDAQVQTALGALGAAPDQVALGLAGGDDCYVLGGRTPATSEQPSPPPRAAFWVNDDRFEPVRIELADGVRYELGPPQEHGGIRVPGFVDIETPAGGRWRLSIRDATAHAPPAGAFQTPAPSGSPNPGSPPEIQP